MIQHAQIPVKVNAQVDAGVAPLVEALNTSPHVTTVSSCEGGTDREAYVAFFVGQGWRELGKFVSQLSVALGQDDDANDLPFSLSVEWHAGGGTPMGYVRVPRQHVQTLTASVRAAVETM